MPGASRVPASFFLLMAVLMPVTYLLLTPFTLFTLGSGCWETCEPGSSCSGPGSGSEAVAGVAQQAM